MHDEGIYSRAGRRGLGDLDLDLERDLERESDE